MSKIKYQMLIQWSEEDSCYVVSLPDFPELHQPCTDGETYEEAARHGHELEVAMCTLSASEARANLYRLIDEVAASHEPVRITGKRHNAVLLSESDWTSVQETLYLLGIPGMRESIREGLDTPMEECDEELDW